MLPEFCLRFEYLAQFDLCNYLFMLCCRIWSLSIVSDVFHFQTPLTGMNPFYVFHNPRVREKEYNGVPFSSGMNFRFLNVLVVSPPRSGPYLIFQEKTIPLAVILLMIIHLHVPFQELSLPSRRKVSAGPLAVIIIIRLVSLHTVYAYHLHLGGFFLKPITSATSYGKTVMIFFC